MNNRNYLNRRRWLGIVLFLYIICADWFYIFSTSQQAIIITPLVILISFIIPLLLFLSLISSIGIYFSKRWGFVWAYLLVMVSIIFVIVADLYIPRETMTKISYLSVLIGVNAVVFLYIVFFQRLLNARHQLGSTDFYH